MKLDKQGLGVVSIHTLKPTNKLTIPNFKDINDEVIYDYDGHKVTFSTGGTLPSFLRGGDFYAHDLASGIFKPMTRKSFRLPITLAIELATNSKRLLKMEGFTLDLVNHYNQRVYKSCITHSMVEIFSNELSELINKLNWYKFEGALGKLASFGMFGTTDIVHLILYGETSYLDLLRARIGVKVFHGI